MIMRILRFRWPRGIEYQWVSGTSHARSPVYQSIHECMRRAVDHGRRYTKGEFLIQIYDVEEDGALKLIETRRCI